MHAEQREVTTDAVGRPPRISWGAIFAGLVFVISMSWLLYLFGLAIGVSIADAANLSVINSGLGTGAVFWIMISGLVVYFLGSMLTARLTGESDSTSGMLHGVTLWSVGTALLLVLGTWGIGSFVQGAFTVLQGTARATASAATAAGSGVGYLAYGTDEAVAMLEDTALSNGIKARLKRQAAEVVAETEAPGGPQITQQEAEQSIENLDQSTLQAIADHLAAGEPQEAKSVVAENTALSQAQVNELIEGVSQEIQEQLGTEENKQPLAADIQEKLKENAASLVASAEAKGGPQVTQSEVAQAIEQLDRETLQAVAGRIMDQDVEGAKNILAANTTLTEAQINEVVEGVNKDVSEQVEAYQKQVSQAVEAASDYTEAVLWTVFVASAIGLAVSVLGGHLGAETTRRLYPNIQRGSATS